MASELVRQKASYEGTIGRLESALACSRQEVQALLDSRDSLAEALGATQRNINARAHRIQRRSGGLVGRTRSLATFILKSGNRT